jgi:hypothetical protein
MYFLYIKIMNKDYKENVVLALESVGVDKASYFEARNLDKDLSNELPLFKGFFISEEEKHKRVGIIMALYEEKGQLDEFLRLLEASGLDVKSGEVVRIATWKADYIV